MKHLRLHFIAVGIFAITIGNPKELNAEMTISTPTIIAATLGSIGGAVGLYQLYQWLTREESNEQLRANGTIVLQSTEYQHRDILQFFHGIFSINLGTSYTKHDIASLPDSALVRCAERLYEINRFDSWYVFRDMRESISALQFHKQKITQRCTALLQKNLDAQQQAEYSQLQALAGELHTLIEKLACITALSDFHGNYFQFYKELHTFDQHYEYHLNALIPNVGTMLFEQILGRVITPKVGLFPLVDYAQELKYDLERLHEINGNISIRYQTLYETVHDLVNNLTTLYHAINASSVYRHQLTAYNADRIEQERLRLERERLALARQQLHAQQSLAHSHERLANAYEWETWNNWWRPRPTNKETVVVVTPPAPVVVQAPLQQPTQPQPPVTVINNINNPVCNQEVKPKIKQKPTIKQSPTITIENKTEQPSKKDTSSQSRWDEDMYHWSSINSNFE